MSRKRKCAECGEQFQPKAATSKVCYTPECQKAHQNKRSRAGGSSRPDGDPRKGPRQRYRKKGSAPVGEAPGANGGGKLRRGGTNRGNPFGRTRAQLRERLRDIVGLSTEELIGRLTDNNYKALEELSIPELRALIKDAGSLALGAPKQQVKVGGTGDDGEMMVSVVGPRAVDAAAAAAPVIAAAVVAAIQPKSNGDH